MKAKKTTRPVSPARPVSSLRPVRPAAPRQPLLEALERRDYCSASAGLQFVGLSNTTADPGNAATVAALIVSASKSNASSSSKPHSFHVENLPFEFNPGDPFGADTTLVQQALPAMKGKLRVSLDLQWFPHTVAQGVNDQNRFWAAWAASRP